MKAKAATAAMVYKTREHLRGKYHCIVDLLFDLFGLVCFAKKCHVIQVIPNQSNRRSTIQ